MLSHLLDGVFSTTSKVHLLRVFARASRALSGREAERLAGITHRPAVHALEELSLLGIVTKERASGQHLYTLNRRHRIAQAIDILFQVEQARIDAVFAWLRRFGRQATKQGHEALGISIFGSAARGDDHPGSDIDLLCTVRHQRSVKPFRDALLQAAEAFMPQWGLRFSVLVLSLNDVRTRAAQGDTLLTAAMRDERTVYGSSIAAITAVRGATDDD